MSIKVCRTIVILLLSFTCVVMGQYAHADTNVGGNITANTTWSVAGSPYIVTSTVQVLERVKLTIEPGVEIRFEPKTNLHIGGELNAIGTQGQMITFTSNQSSWLGYISFTSAAVGAQFDGAFNYLSGSIIKFCVFKSTEGIVSEIPLYIGESRSNTMRLRSSQGSVVKNNVITGPGTGYGTGIHEIDNSFIYNNTITRFRSGINAYSNNIIRSNTIKDCEGAMSIGGGNKVEYNTITKCMSYSNQGSIVVIKGPNTTVSNNIIVDNNAYSTIYFFGDTSGSVIMYNDIYGNDSEYEIRTKSANDIDATYNYWGTVNATSIADKIYDYYDNIAFGKVIFEPFATQPYSTAPPTAVTVSASSVTRSSATLNGTVNPNGASTTYHFQYGTSIGYGSSTPSTSAGSGTSALSVSFGVSDLSLNTTYHYRIAATNRAGTSYGTDMTFVTASPPPTVTTNSATSVTSTSAILNGTVNPNGLSTNYYFEYGPTMSYGSSTSSASAGSGSSAISVNATVSELTLDTTYHYRLVATNSEGTSYGDDKAFSTVILYVEPFGSCGGNIPCYLTIQAAIDAAETESVIKILHGTYDEDIIIDQAYDLTLLGGWNSTFTSQSSASTVSSITISGSGWVTVEYLVME